MWLDILITILLLALVILAMLPRWLSDEKRYLAEVLKASPELNTVTLSRGETHYQLLGEPQNPTIVLIHGFSVPSFAWESNREALATSGFQVLTFDLYGRGFSARPSIKYTQDLFVEQLNDLLEALNIDKPVHLVGLSLGGSIASFFNQTYPEKVASVSLLAPFSRPIPVGPLAWPILGRYLAYVFYIPNLLKKQLVSCIKPQTLSLCQSRYKEQMAIKGFRNAIYSSAIHAIQQDPMPSYAKLKSKPRLLLWGGNDEFLPIRLSNKVRESLGEGHEFQVIEGAGHGLQFEQAERVNQALIEFLSKNRQP